MSTELLAYIAPVAVAIFALYLLARPAGTSEAMQKIVNDSTSALIDALRDDGDNLRRDNESMRSRLIQQAREIDQLFRWANALGDQLRTVGITPRTIADYPPRDDVTIPPLATMGNAKLLGVLKDGFNSDEITSMAFEVGMPSDQLGDGTARSRANQLFDWARRNKKLSALGIAVRTERPEAIF